MVKIKKPLINRLFFATLKSIFKKELIHISRNPVVLTFALVAPIFEILLLGYILDINVKQVDTAVYDMASTQESRQLLKQFTNTNTFRIKYYANSDTELYDLMKKGEIKIGIKIPVNYSQLSNANLPASVLLLIDGSNAVITNEIVNVSSRLTLEESLKHLINNNGAVSSDVPIQSRPSVLFNPDTRSANFFLPGLIVWEIPAVTIVLVLLAFVTETEKGTIEQLAITPISPAGFIIGKMSPYMILAFLLVIEILIITKYVFHVPINGSVLLLLGLTIPYIFASAGLGVALSGGANTQIDAMQLGLIFRVFPPFYFTGYVFPLESSPEFFQAITKLIPERYLMEICRGIVIRGTTFENLWTHGLILVLMSFVTLFLAVNVYRKKLQ